MPQNIPRKIPAREKLLEAAGSLFYRSGFHAVGVDTIVAESGTTKMTLYKNFPSKDHLITAYLERSNDKFWEWIAEIVKEISDPCEQLVAIFEGIEKLSSSPECLGCTFQAVAVEFPSQEHMAHHEAIAHKDAVLERFRGLAEQAGLQSPKRLANQLLLLMDGAMISARLYGPDNPAADVAAAAQFLIESHRKR